MIYLTNTELVLYDELPSLDHTDNLKYDIYNVFGTV